MFIIKYLGHLILYFIFLLMISSCNSQSKDIQHSFVSKSSILEPSYDFSPKPGDLFFQDLLGPAATAIESVTPGYNNAEVAHMGMVVKVNSALYVIEAIHPKVQITTIEGFLNRSKDKLGRPKVFVGRVKPQFQNLIPSAINNALKLKGLPYDYAYLPGENSYYCSELIVDAFKYSNDGVEVFPDHPMSFRDMKTGEIPKFWINYYKRLGIKIPEGEPGSNPGEISLSDKITIIHRYGFLTNWQ